MSLVYSIHQPCYFPWLGLLHKIAKSDFFILLDEVQLSDSAYQHRGSFLTSDGKVKLLTIPIEKKNYLQKPFKDLRVADPNWGEAHKNFLRSNYSKHPNFDQIFPEIDEVFSISSPFLIDIVIASMRATMGLLGIKTELLFQSKLNYDRSARKGDLVLELLQACGARTYLSGRGAMAYQDETQFDGYGIRLIYSEFTHCVYPQKGVGSFVSGLSSVDLLCNVGADSARSYIL